MHEGKKYPCRECDYQATVNGTSTKHQRALHAGNVITMQGQKLILLNMQAINERNRYLCMKCDYQAIEKGSLSKH